MSVESCVDVRFSWSLDPWHNSIILTKDNWGLIVQNFDNISISTLDRKTFATLIEFLSSNKHLMSSVFTGPDKKFPECSRHCIVCERAPCKAGFVLIRLKPRPHKDPRHDKRHTVTSPGNYPWSLTTMMRWCTCHERFFDESLFSWVCFVLIAQWVASLDMARDGHLCTIVDHYYQQYYYKTTTINNTQNWAI